MSRRAGSLATFGALLALILAPGSQSGPWKTVCGPTTRPHTERVNVSTNGEETNGDTYRGPMNANGRFVTFSSDATNLVSDDDNGVEDVFVRDRLKKETIRVSVSSTGEEANGASYDPLISADGRVIGFRSVATNLAPGEGHNVEGFFVHDLRTGRTERIPLGPTGENPARPHRRTRQEVCDRWCVNAIDADGSVLVVTSRASHLVPDDRNRRRDVFAWARGRTVGVTVAPHIQANGPSEGASISGDGRIVAFRSFASNLVRGDTNKVPDVFVRNLATGVIQRVNVSSSGTQANAESFRGMVSADGRFVGFRSSASNLVPRDTNRALDVFVHDRITGKTTRISVASDGAQARSVGFSPLVRHVIFMSRPFLSADGRFAAFTSRARNLVRGDTNRRADVFVHDLKTHRTVRVSVADAGGQGNGDSRVAGISADGRIVGFISYASNLVPDDTNGGRDYFVRDRGLPACR